VLPHLCPLAKLLRVPWNNIVNLAKSIWIWLGVLATLGHWEIENKTVSHTTWHYHQVLLFTHWIWNKNTQKAEQWTKLVPYLKGTLKILRHGIMLKLLGRRIREHYICMWNNENPWMYSNSRCLQTPNVGVQDAIHHQLGFHLKSYIGLKSFPSWHSQ